MKTTRSAFGVLVLAAVSLVGPPDTARAQSENPRKELEEALQQGLALYKQGKRPQAIPLLEKALALAPRTFGAEDLNTAALMHLLGNVHMEVGNLEKATPLLRGSFQILESRLGKDNPKLANSLSSHACTTKNSARRWRTPTAHNSTPAAVYRP